MLKPPLRLAVIGAGPAGLALALLASQRWPEAQVTVYDARPADKDLSGDPRALALSLGSVQLLERLGAWPASAAQPIRTVHVSQAAPTLQSQRLQPEVSIRAEEVGVTMLGAVLRYGQLVAPMQAAWQRACDQNPERCRMRYGTPVADLKTQGDHVEIDAGVADEADLAVVAEGGVFADQSRKGVTHDYRQAAWVGSVLLGSPREAPSSGAAHGADAAQADSALRSTAYERFTQSGPVALLPMPPLASDAAHLRRASLVWCVNRDDDPVVGLTTEQRRAVLATLIPRAAGELLELGPLKAFALGLNAERTLVQGRTVRIGNAAQTLHPVAGQGLNLGLRDAYAMVEALRSAADIDAALRRIEWARAADRWQMIAATDFLARSFTWRWPGLGAIRGLGLAALQALPPVKHRLARQMMYGMR